MQRSRSASSADTRIMNLSYWSNMAAVALAIASGLLASRVARNWHSKESLAYNVFMMAQPYIFPSVEPYMGLPKDELVAFFAKITKGMEKSASSEGNAKFFGRDFHQASFGPRQTRVVELEWTASDATKIPTICTCPHNADKSHSRPLIFYYFGGGLVLGSPKAELVLARWLSDQTEAVVCSVGYRYAPQYPYPIPIEDALDGSIRILEREIDVEQALDVSIDFDRVGTFGISAGGYMSSHMSRRLTERGYTLKCLVAFVPMAKPLGGTASMLKNWNADWSGPQNAYAWAAFLPGDDGTLARDWRVSLLVDPPNPDIIDKLPPAYIQIHSRDILRDEGEMYAERLRKQGKLIALVEIDTSHVGALPGISDGGPGEGSLVRAVQVLKDHLANR